MFVSFDKLTDSFDFFLQKICCDSVQFVEQGGTHAVRRNIQLGIRPGVSDIQRVVFEETKLGANCYRGSRGTSRKETASVSRTPCANK
jgi:hypothetical protein